MLDDSKGKLDGHSLQRMNGVWRFKSLSSNVEGKEKGGSFCVASPAWRGILRPDSLLTQCLRKGSQEVMISIRLPTMKPRRFGC